MDYSHCGAGIVVVAVGGAVAAGPSSSVHFAEGAKIWFAAVVAAALSVGHGSTF